jgi:hypothetical protein
METRKEETFVFGYPILVVFFFVIMEWIRPYGIDANGIFRCANNVFPISLKGGTEPFYVEFSAPGSWWCLLCLLVIFCMAILWINRIMTRLRESTY